MKNVKKQKKRLLRNKKKNTKRLLKRKRLQKLKRAHGKKKYKPYEPVKMKTFSFENPFAHLSLEQRREMAKVLGSESEKKFRELYPKLQDWFSEYDPLYLLSFCSVYFLCMPEGIDKEAIDGKLDFYHHYLEILQAFSLMQDRSLSIKPLNQDSEKLMKNMQEIDSSLKFRDIALSDNASKEEISKKFVLAKMKGQTLAIRNWSYPGQIFKYANEIFLSMSKEFEDEYGVPPDKIIQLLRDVLDHFEDKLNEYLIKVGAVYRENDLYKMFEIYHSNFPDTKKSSKEEIDHLYKERKQDIDQLKYSLMAHADLRLEKIFTVDLDKLVELYGDKNKRNEIEEIFDLWAYKFGDLKEANTEHFILNNPVLKKPFIVVEEGKYFSPILGILGHMLFPMMEGLILNNGKLLKKYNDDIKGVYLEDQVENIIRKRFPTAIIHRNIFRKQNGEVYENDVVVMIDNFVLVVECKSGTAQESAKRGGDLGLVRTLETLVVEPSKQANDLIKYLTSNKGIVDFSTKKEKISIDCDKIDYYIPLVVNLENLGSVGSNLRQSIEGGLIKKPPEPLVSCINLGDFESIFEILNNEIECIHYLLRRADIEKHFNYEADELDLLAFYLDHGFNIGEAEFDDQTAHNLGMKSKELDPYFTAKERGKSIEKPSLSMTNWWRDIITKLVERKPDRWIEIGFILLNATKGDQEQLEVKLGKLEDSFNRGDKKYDYIELRTISGGRKYYILIFAFDKIDHKEKIEKIKDIVHDAEERNKDLLAGICVAVYGFDHKKTYPYSTLAYLPKNLFKK